MEKSENIIADGQKNEDLDFLPLNLHTYLTLKSLAIPIGRKELGVCTYPVP